MSKHATCGVRTGPILRRGSPRPRVRCGAVRARSALRPARRRKRRSAPAPRTEGRRGRHDARRRRCLGLSSAVRSCQQRSRPYRPPRSRWSWQRARRLPRLYERRLERARPGVGRGSAGQRQSLISGSSSPCSRVAPARPGACRFPGAARPHVSESGHTIDHVHDEVEAIKVVEHDHVEWCRRRALFDEATGVQVRVVGASISEPVDEPRIAVEREDDRFGSGEQRVELRPDIPCGAPARRSAGQATFTNSEIGQLAAQDVRRGKGLERGDVATAGEDHVGGAAVVQCWPTATCRRRACSARSPRPSTASSTRLLAGDDHVDVVLQAQAVIAPEQRVPCPAAVNGAPASC